MYVCNILPRSRELSLILVRAKRTSLFENAPRFSFDVDVSRDANSVRWMQCHLLTFHAVSVLIDGCLESTFRHTQISVNGVERQVVASSSTTHPAETTASCFDVYGSGVVSVGIVGAAEQFRCVLLGYGLECGHRCGQDSDVGLDHTPVHGS